MIEKFYYLNFSLKILFFLSFCFAWLFTLLTIVVLPSYQQFRSLQNEKIQLIEKYHVSLSNLSQYSSLTKRLKIAKNQFDSQQLLKTMTIPSIILLITHLIKSQHLVLISIIPQKGDQSVNLMQQMLTLTLKGNESEFFSFLQLLIHQFRFVDIQKMEIKSDQHDITIQAILAVYYVDN